MNNSNGLNSIEIKTNSDVLVLPINWDASKVLRVELNVANNSSEKMYHLVQEGISSLECNQTDVTFAIIFNELKQSDFFGILSAFTKILTSETTEEGKLYISNMSIELGLNIVTLKVSSVFLEAFKNVLSELSQQYFIDYLLNENKIGLPSLEKPGLLVMDMDSTAIEIECIDEIAKLYGVGRAVSEVTERAMQGELDFSESLRARVAKLEGASETILSQVRNSLPLMPGLEKLVTLLTEKQWKVVIASGGFTYFSDFLKDKLGLFETYANQLEIKDGLLTGQVKGDIVDAKFKALILTSLSEKLGFSKSQTVAIGDGANDLPMLKTAALGVAYHAKPSVQAASAYRINHNDLRVLYIILSLVTQWAR
ncbi:phosphoserine phosphatase SerB [Thorsellia kenyensis]|uniref:Phosphoserine phosphatase n=1 Tax=Thorsellia kenyensis TaxID=1549888 RepID=A0ABV6C6R4_9GAMM